MTCIQCGGTGWLWLLKGWFAGDGLRRERCGLCGGTGSSSYRSRDRSFMGFVRGQRKRRESQFAQGR
jgi:hypothetical protein